MANNPLSDIPSGSESLTANVSYLHTLLLSECGTYPGIVAQVMNEVTAMIHWYKWGYDGPDFIQDWMPVHDLYMREITPEECIRRFGALPPELSE